MQPDRPNAVMTAIIGNRNACTTRTGAILIARQLKFCTRYG
jgi:hypothetical protein